MALNRNASLPSHLKGAVVSAARKADIRKVVIAFDAVPVGRNLARWALQTCLFPDDTVNLVCCINPKVRAVPAASWASLLKLHGYMLRKLTHQGTLEGAVAVLQGWVLWQQGAVLGIPIRQVHDMSQPVRGRMFATM